MINSWPDLYDVVTPGNLYFMALVFGFLTLTSVCLIYYKLYLKKKQSRDFKAIEELLNQWISEALIEESEDFTHKYIVADLLDYFSKERYRQFTIDRLIKSQISLKGSAVANILNLYNQLELQYDSAQKYRSTEWHKKARGIYELYMMEQKQYKDLIAEETNHRNEYIRMEAQIALIAFDGFDGLEFLSSLTRPLTEWQQLKILDQLQTASFKHMEHLNSWILSANMYVSLFAMKLADIYQQYQAHDTIISLFVSTDNEKVKIQGVRSLGKLALGDTSTFLKRQYLTSGKSVKIEIIRALGRISDEENLSFLEEVSQDADDKLKIEAVRSMFLCTTDKADLTQRLLERSVVAKSIIKQVTYEYSV